MNYTKILEFLIVNNLIIAMVVSLFIALMIRDYKFIIKNKVSFIIELLFMCIIPAILFAYVFHKTRHVSIKHTINIAIFFAVKLLIFHILFQLSGLYKNLTPKNLK